MSSLPGISCIIPFWNEGRNLFNVLKEIVKVRNLSEIICVDDGSVDGNHHRIKRKYPEVKVIRLEKNRGKTGAVREGLKHAKGHHILLLDADLRNLKYREIENAVDAFTSVENIDMLILRRVNAILPVKIYRADVLFSGERLLRKPDLETILNGSSVNGWQLESAINTWMLANRKNVRWIAHSGINMQKYDKWGLMTGLRLDLKTYRDMISATGFTNIVRQILFFARNELRPGVTDQGKKKPKPVSVVETV